MDRVDPILVVDGDADTRAMYRDALAIAGFEVVEAVDGREALVKALVHPPRLVITESRLEFIDGYALCGILRRDRATAAVPILVVTTEGHPAQIGRARMAGADVVLVKPTSIETILQETQLLLDHRHTGERGTAIKGMSKSFSRLTTTRPPLLPPALICPSCDRPLRYERSEVGGVSHRNREQWDYYACSSCGSFQLRQRTRKFRKVS